MELEAITRQEQIIAGKDLQPVTRMEFFLKAYGGGGSGGGGSIPKPLTYDYMPEGYPSKSVGTVTLMEEQEVTFSDMGRGPYGATAPVKIDISDGQTYIIVWDGVEYSCVGHVADGSSYIGNPAILGLESTGEPFLYANASAGQSIWGAYDAAASHTIKVTTIGTIYQTIDVNMLPKAGENYGVVKKDEIVTAYVFPSVSAPQLQMNKAIDDFAAGKAKITWNGNNVLEARRSSDTEIIIRLSRDPVNVYKYTANEVGHYYSQSVPSEYVSPDLEVMRIYIRDENNPLSGGSFIGPITGVYNSYDDNYIEFGTTRIYEDGIAIKSSGSDKMFKITVDDSGTLKATEVT